VCDTRAAERDAQAMPTKTEHAEYLQSDQWQQLRKRVIADYPFCERCTMPRWLAEIAYDQDLHVHHKTYRNRGKEKLEDLEVLCRRCHELETFGRSELREIKSATCSLCEKKHWDRRGDQCSYCARLLKEGPCGLRKYEAERLPGYLSPEGGPTWAEVMPYEIRGTEIERRIALHLCIQNPYLEERTERGPVFVHMLVDLWMNLGTDPILDVLGKLEQCGPVDNPPVMEKKQ
jgi:hypothetical protein